MKKVVANNDPENKPKKKKGHALRNVMIALLVILVALMGVAYVTFDHYYKKADFVKDSDVTVGTLPAEVAETENNLSPEEEASLAAEVQITEESLAETDLEGIYSILMIGADRRDASWNGNSDAVVLMTVNNNTKQIYMTSFMRDLYANVPGRGVHKLNYAYAVGGGPLLVQTLEENYGVKIDNYASVDFAGLAAVVNVMGGIDVTVKDYEIPELQEVGINAAGTYHMNGEQALRYARIRHHGNSDFERTERHRYVINALMNNARSLSATELVSTADAVLPYVLHNMDQATVLKNIANTATWLKYEVVQMRIPEDGTWHSSNEILVPNDINSVIVKLRGTLYATGN